MKKAFYHLQSSIAFKAILLLVVLILVNSVLRSVFFRLDLTEDKRYTISQSTIGLLAQLEDPVNVTVYLDGDLNQGFQQLRDATSDLLNEFSIYGKERFSFSFVSPDKVSRKKNKQLFASFDKLGITPINVVEEGANGKVIQKPVFPWALIDLGGKKYPVKLLVNIPGKNGSENLNISIQNLEFQLTDAIRILNTTNPQKVAFIEGHGELSDEDVYDVTSALSRYYQIDRGAIGTDPEVLAPYSALIIAHPKQPFNEREKFILDQYLMKGGKILWFIDGVDISLDSLAMEPTTIGLYNDLNLEDMLFRYGARINPVLLQDMQCALIPVNFSAPGEKANFHPVPWFYAPILSTSQTHPITANLSPVKGDFTSSIDTVGSMPGLVRKFLLQSSAQTNVFQAPAPVNLNIATSNVDSKYFSHGSRPVALLAEGVFPSVFKNRSVPSGIAMDRTKVLKESRSTRMLIVADGDILRNEVEGQGASQQIYPLNYDRYTKQELYGNKEFVVNAVNYLTDGEEWLGLRNRSFKLRLLNKIEANEKRLKWQLINVLAPILLMMLSGIGFVAYRRKKYGKASKA